MRCKPAILLAVGTLTATPSLAQVAQVQLAFDTYAAGIEVMQMHAFFGVGPWNYRIEVDYHTTGLVGLLYRGTQINTVRGMWQDNEASPLEFYGKGHWRGRDRLTWIDYDHGLPHLKELQPPQETERELVPQDMQRHTVDTLSALAQLMRHVQHSQDCETRVRTYDGRRLLDVAARTAGFERLDETSRSMFHGPALRCDFEGSELAGFMIGENDPEHHRPLHGVAWLAPLLPNAPPLPVRVAFETRWFGWATMYLTSANNRPE